MGSLRRFSEGLLFGCVSYPVQCTAGKAEEWSPAISVRAHRLIEENRCDLLTQKLDSNFKEPNEPLLLLDAISAEQQESMRQETLLKRFGNLFLKIAHPGYVPLAEGNPEEETKLSDYTKAMRYFTPVNGSVVFSALGPDADDLLRIMRSDAERAVPILRKYFAKEDSSFHLSLAADSLGLMFHTHGETLLSLYHGYKLWLIAEPGDVTQTELLDPMHGHGFRLLDTLENLSMASALKGKVYRCIQPPGSMLFLPPMWWHATVNLGDTIGLAFQGKPNMKSVKQSLKKDKNDVDALFKAASLLSWNGQLDKADKYLRLALRASPDHVPSYFLASQVAHGKNDPSEALKLMMKAKKVMERIAKEADPQVPYLTNAMLLRLAFTFCRPLAEVGMGSKIYEAALKLNMRSRLGLPSKNWLLEHLDECRKQARDEM